MKTRLLLFLLILSANVLADDANRLMIQAQKLYKDKQYLEAMDSATYALSLNQDSRAAKTFIYKHYDRAIKQALATIEQNADTKDLQQSEARLKTYQLLVDITDNLSRVSLPLHGYNDVWIWQPELQYYDGYVAEEERNVEACKKRLLMN